jgi:hypothetical protein
MVNLIIKTVTKNSITIGWSCARIAQEVYNTEGVTPKEALLASTIYYTLKKEGYNVYKRTIKLGLNAAQKKARYN